MDRTSGLRHGQIVLSCAALLMTARAAPIQAEAKGVDSTPAPLMKRIDVSYDLDSRIAAYAPKLDPWIDFDFRIHPVITAKAEGAKRIGLRIILMDPPQGQPDAFTATVDGEPWAVPISSADDVQTSGPGCRISQTITLQNQKSLVRAIAQAGTVEISVRGYEHRFPQGLSAENLDWFKTMLALW